MPTLYYKPTPSIRAALANGCVTLYMYMYFVACLCVTSAFSCTGVTSPTYICILSLLFFLYLSSILPPPSLPLSLPQIGALTVLHRGRVVPYDGTLTFLGQVLASLPVDVRLGKLLVLGHAFGCLEECLVIAAALSQKTFFTKPFGNELRGYRCEHH